MVYEFKLPDVGEGIHEGEIVKWHVKEGDIVKTDQTIAEIETDKAVVEIPSPKPGTILKINFKEGETAKVGEVLVVIGEAGEKAPETAAPVKEEELKEEPKKEELKEEKSIDTIKEENPAEQPKEQPAESPKEKTKSAEPASKPAKEATPAPTKTPPAKPGRIVAAPSTRKLAREMKIDLSTVTGTDPGEKITDDDVKRAGRQTQTAATAQPSTGAVQAAQTTAPTGKTEGKTKATPKVRKMAKEMGIDISQVTPTGPEERVTEADIKTFKPGAAAALGPAAGAPAALSAGLSHYFQKVPIKDAGEVERITYKGVRKAIGKHMEQSMFTATHVTHIEEIDVTDLAALRKREKPMAEKRGIKLTYLPFIVKALVAALKEFPYMNSSLDETTGEIVLKKYYNIGIAVDTDDGLMVPIVKDADQKNILDIAKEIHELAKKARDHKLTLPEMRDGTFTITNVGSLGGIASTPIINFPEVAILGVHKIVDRPMVRDGRLKKKVIAVRKMVNFAISFDHRVVDGAYVARCMNEIKKHLEDPGRLLIEG